MSGDYCEDYENDGLSTPGIDDDLDDKRNDYEEQLREINRQYERQQCLFGDDCCMPGDHTSDECHTAEMIEQQYEEFKD